MAKQPSAKKNKKTRTPTKPAENPISLDSVCTCQRCDHGLARDCLKVECICCKDYNHSMVLDGIEGFPPTQNQNKNVDNSNQSVVKEKLVKVAAGKVTLEGNLVIPNEEYKGIVLFAHGNNHNSGTYKQSKSQTFTTYRWLCPPNSIWSLILFF
jgi:hypothetical protein